MVIFSYLYLFFDRNLTNCQPIRYGGQITLDLTGVDGAAGGQILSPRLFITQ